MIRLALGARMMVVDVVKKRVLQRFGGWLLLLFGMLGSLTLDRAFADEDFCKAYADAAIETLGEMNQSGCGFTGPRWNPKWQDHHDACVGWGADAGILAIKETNGRSADLSVCRANQAGAPPIKPPVDDHTGIISLPTTLVGFCTNYMVTGTTQFLNMVNRNCGYSGPRWALKYADDYNACMGWGPSQAGTITAKEMNGREQDLIACERARLQTTTNPPTDQPPAPDWADMLKVHNEKRSLHCTPPLVWDARLAAEAQQWADQCTNTHSQTPNEGENLAMASSIVDGNPKFPAMSDRDVFDNIWYCEIQWYDFDNPQLVGGFKNGCDPPVNGHFTQTVWRGTQRLGCGRKTCGQSTYWVCRYSAQGNNPDPAVLAQNVLRPTCK